MSMQSYRCGAQAAVRHAFMTASLIAGSFTVMSPSWADSVEDFYKNNRVTIVVGSPAGASYDLYGRLLQRHYGNHLPGSPDIVVVNKPGAGSLSAANGLYNDPRKDGTTLGMLGQSIYFMQMLGP
jgi:tripartite-type tricarboxylate transporter receptor subunit TctC